MKDAKRWIVVCLAAFIAGSVISVAVDRHAVNRQGRMTESPTALPRTVRANIATYKYINPLLFTTSTKSVLPVFQNLSATLAAQVRTATSSGIAQSVSVYVRDMNDNEWTGVGEDEKYTPSSMLKVVAMMSALKLAESDPAILQTKLSYHKTAPANELFPAHN